MNERIREIAMSVQRYRHWTEEDIEKFGELIVRECMSLVSEPGPDMNDTERGILAQIKQHFGIEE